MKENKENNGRRTNVSNKIEREKEETENNNDIMTRRQRKEIVKKCHIISLHACSVFVDARTSIFLRKYYHTVRDCYCIALELITGFGEARSTA